MKYFTGWGMYGSMNMVNTYPKSPTTHHRTTIDAVLLLPFDNTQQYYRLWHTRQKTEASAHQHSTAVQHSKPPDSTPFHVNFIYNSLLPFQLSFRIHTMIVFPVSCTVRIQIEVWVGAQKGNTLTFIVYSYYSPFFFLLYTLLPIPYWCSCSLP